MAEDLTLTVTLKKFERLESSRLGNPTYRIIHSEGAHRTATNAGVAYQISNQLIGERVTLYLTNSDTVWDMRWPRDNEEK